VEMSGYIAFMAYLVGLAGWYGVWHYLLGFSILKRMKLLLLPFLGAQFVFGVNMVLAFFTESCDYTTELALYQYVEANATTVGGMSLAIAVFWVFASRGNMLEEADPLVKMFLWLLFWSFLFSVLGVLPLYWCPPGGYWLMTLRHIKTVPFLYGLFTLASALVVFMYKLGYKRNLADVISVLSFGDDAEDAA